MCEGAHRRACLRVLKKAEPLVCCGVDMAFQEQQKFTECLVRAECCAVTVGNQATCCLWTAYCLAEQGGRCVGSSTQPGMERSSREAPGGGLQGCGGFQWAERDFDGERGGMLGEHLGQMRLPV